MMDAVAMSSSDRIALVAGYLADAGVDQSEIDAISDLLGATTNGEATAAADALVGTEIGNPLAGLTQNTGIGNEPPPIPSPARRTPVWGLRASGSRWPRPSPTVRSRSGTWPRSSSSASPLATGWPPSRRPPRKSHRLSSPSR